MSGSLIWTRKPTRLPYCFAIARVVLQYAFGIQAAGALLQLAPGGPDVEFLAQRHLREGLDRLLHVHAPEGVASEVARDVGNETHSVAGHDRARGRRGHHDLGTGEHFLGRVLRKRPLVKAFLDHRRSPPVVAVPVVSRDEAQGGAGGGGPQARGASLRSNLLSIQPPSGRTSFRPSKSVSVGRASVLTLTADQPRDLVLVLVPARFPDEPNRLALREIDNPS